MKDPTHVAEIHGKLGAPATETVESLRLLRAFLKLAPARRFEVIKLVESFCDRPRGRFRATVVLTSHPGERLNRGRAGARHACRVQASPAL